jgi:hypothetical protein
MLRDLQANEVRWVNANDLLQFSGDRLQVVSR